MTITERLAEHGRVVASLISKVRAGRILSPRETSWVERVCDAAEPKDRGRPRSERAALPIYDSMASCSAHTGIPLHVLKLAKQAGCPAFGPNRIDLREFLRWRFTAKGGQGEAAADWGSEVRREDALMRRLKRERTAGALVPRSWIADRIRRMCGELNALEVRSEAQHPVRMAAAGADVAQNRAVLRSVWDEIRRMLQSLGDHLENGSFDGDR